MVSDNVTQKLSPPSLNHPWDSGETLFNMALIAFYSRGGLEARCPDKDGVSDI